MTTTLTIQTTVDAPLEKVWECYTIPGHITQWNHASDDWHSPSAINDLRIGGTFTYRMEAHDSSEGFDFTGTYTDIQPQQLIAYRMDDGRTVEVTFDQQPEGVQVTVTFQTETMNPVELQRAGWQAILDNFQKYVETL